MDTQDRIDFERIARAIDHLRKNYRDQPKLDEVAAAVHLSPFHFQRMFRQWAGVSPKKFLQYISLEAAKGSLRSSASLSEAAMESGLSGSSRLHDLFVNIEGMTPAEYKHGGKGLQINYQYSDSPFGPLIVAATKKGVCYMAFEQDNVKALRGLQEKFPNALFVATSDEHQLNALKIFRKDWTSITDIKLHLKGTPFQLKVWECLLNIPFGALSTYGQIAARIGQMNASRAVGTAIGSNPIAYLIPCHRVIRSSGIFGEYMWGPSRKAAMIGWEAAMSDILNEAR